MASLDVFIVTIAFPRIEIDLRHQGAATGAAVLSMSRQIGAVLGVAALVALLGTVSSSDRAGGFHRGCVFLTVAAALAATAALAIGKVRQHEPAAGPVRADADAAGAR
jgi:Ca2+/Na+ antiporter